MIGRSVALYSLVVLSGLCVLGVEMEENQEENMELGTQSQSQMDTSDLQESATIEMGKGDAKTSGEQNTENQDENKTGGQKPDNTKPEMENSDKKSCGEKTSDENNCEEVKSNKNSDNSKKMGDTDEPKFPSTLEGFGYEFNDEGQMRHLETGEAFVFKVRPRDDEFNQMRYEALGEVITQYVYDLLEKDTNLKRVKVPVDASDGEPQSFIFMSEDALTNPDKLLLLIHGSGVVRAGQWARRLIINDCLSSGTQLPFIRKAMENGYGVLVFNTNENSVRQGDKVTPIRGSANAVDHGIYVWDEFVSKAAAKHIAIVAHSYGGVVTVELAIERETEFKERVFAIALTDSVHSLAHQDSSPSVIKLFKKVSQNWISSKEPLDTPVSSRNRHECPQVSAGTNKHEETSWSSFRSIFDMLDLKYNSAIEKERQEL